MNSNEKVSFTAAGAIRRDEMRDQLQAAFDRHHRAVKLKKSAAAMALVCSVIVAISYVFLSIGGSEPNQHVAKSPNETNSVQDTLEFQHLSLDYISDQQLQEMLEDAGEPWIIAKIDGKALAIPRKPRSQN